MMDLPHTVVKVWSCHILYLPVWQETGLAQEDREECGRMNRMCLVGRQEEFLQEERGNTGWERGEEGMPSSSGSI